MCTIFDRATNRTSKHELCIACALSRLRGDPVLEPFIDLCVGDTGKQAGVIVPSSRDHSPIGKLSHRQLEQVIHKKLPTIVAEAVP